MTDRIAGLENGGPGKEGPHRKLCDWVARRQDDAYKSVYRNYSYTMSVILHVIHSELSEHMRH